MADQRITELNPITGAQLADNDPLVVVDESDPTMAPSGTNKRLDVGELKNRLTLDNFLKGSGTTGEIAVFNASGELVGANNLKFTGSELDVTGTIAATGNIDTLGGFGASGPSIFAGTITHENSEFRTLNTVSGNSMGQIIAGSGATEQFQLAPSTAPANSLNFDFTTGKWRIGNDEIAVGSGISWSTPVDANILPDGDQTRSIGASGNAFLDIHAAVFNGSLEGSGFEVNSGLLVDLRFAGTTDRTPGGYAVNDLPIWYSSADQRLSAIVGNANVERFAFLSDIPSGPFGDVFVSGTPTDNRIAVWTNANTIEGDGNFIWTGSELAVNGDISATGALTLGGDGKIEHTGTGFVFENTFVGTRIQLPNGGGINGLQYFDGVQTSTVWHGGNLNPANFGDVSATGTPASPQIAVWTGADTIGGSADLEADTSSFRVTNQFGQFFLKSNFGSGPSAFHDISLRGANDVVVAALTYSGGSFTINNANANTRIELLSGGGLNGLVYFNAGSTYPIYHTGNIPAWITDAPADGTTYGRNNNAWVATSGGGIGGSIAANQIAFGTAADTIGGSANLVWTGTELDITGSIGATGNIDTLGGFGASGSSIFAGDVTIEDAIFRIINTGSTNDMDQFITGSGATERFVLSPSTASNNTLEYDFTTNTWRIAGNEILTSGSVTGASWGSITGTLSNQTDLQSALDAKLPTVNPLATGTTMQLDSGTSYGVVRQRRDVGGTDYESYLAINGGNGGALWGWSIGGVNQTYLEQRSGSVVYYDGTANRTLWHTGNTPNGWGKLASASTSYESNYDLDTMLTVGENRFFSSNTNGPSGIASGYAWTSAGGDVANRGVQFVSGRNDGKLFFRTLEGMAWATIWTSQNDGSGSGLDADLVGGYPLTASGNRWGVIPYVATDGVMEVGQRMDWHLFDGDASDYAHRLEAADNDTMRLRGNTATKQFEVYVSADDFARVGANASGGFLTLGQSGGTATILRGYGTSDFYGGSVQVMASAGAGGFVVQNPNNSAATISLNWQSDAPRFRIGGSGTGASAPFTIEGTGDVVRMEVTAAGDVKATQNLYSNNGYLYLTTKRAVQGTDTYLRLNNNLDFTSGVYTPGNLRCDGTLDVGSSGTNEWSTTRLYLYVSSLEALKIRSSVSGNDGAYIRGTSQNGDNNWYFGRPSNVSSYTNWYSYLGNCQVRLNDSGNVAVITSGGNFTVGTTVSSTVAMYAPNFVLSSDARLKMNIQEYGPKLIDIRFREFEMKDRPGEKRVGVIAQELAQRHAEFVDMAENGFLSVRYVDLIMAKLAEMEWRIKRMENSFVISN